MGKPAWMNRVWERAAEEVAAGRQVYVVCSRIGDETGEKAAKSGGDQRREAVALVDLYDEVVARLPQCRVGMLHGRMPADEKAAVMDEFTAGELDVLVSTTVIEVGVDVPNATVMVIIDADRFGISQLHQLRGRVGRGGLAGLCLLVTAAPVGIRRIPPPLGGGGHDRRLRTGTPRLAERRRATCWANCNPVGLVVAVPLAAHRRRRDRRCARTGADGRRRRVRPRRAPRRRRDRRRCDRLPRRLPRQVLNRARNRMCVRCV